MLIATTAVLNIIFLHSIYIYTRGSVWHTILFVSTSILTVLAYSFYIISDYFTGSGVTSGVLYHLEHGRIGEANILGAYTTLIMTALLTLSLYIGLLSITLWYKKKKAHRTLLPSQIIYLFVFAIAVTHPLTKNIYTLHQTPTIDTDYIANTVAPLLALGSSTDPLSFTAYMPQSPISANTSTPQKNLLLIYLEGVEQTFSEDTTFPNLTPNLHRLSQEFVSFTNVHQIESAAYTIGGMVASQCGLPLFSSTSNESHEGMKSSFLGGATCLGDVLQQAGYHNTYIGGAESTFAGKKTFLNSHGYDIVLGKKDLIEIHNLRDTELHNWGVYDDVLFDTYYDTFLERSESGTPFMLTMITLDTHPPLGYVSPRCKAANLQAQANTMLDAVACTDYLVGELVDNVRNSPYYNNTTIVIISDHLAMKNTATPLLERQKRTNRILIIDADSAPATHDSYGTTLDTGTTILPYIGFTGRIGLGQNLQHDTLTPVRQAVKQLHSSWFYDVINLWNPPIFTEDIIIDTTKKEIQLDTQTFAIPSFINFTQNWESAITFRYALPEDTLLKYPAQMEPYKTYLLIEECRILAPNAGYTETYCAGYGSNNEVVTIEPLKENITIISQELFKTKALNTLLTR